MKVSGIYQILNKVNGKFYIGSASIILYRWSTHKYFLVNEKHQNSYLQNAWNKYGASAFEFRELGHKCKCEECKEKVRVYYRNYREICKCLAA